MEKAKYYISGKTADDVAGLAMATGLLPAALDDRPSILGLLHPAARYALERSAKKDEIDLGTLIERAGDSQKAARDLLSRGATENPFRWFVPDGYGRFEPRSTQPASAALAFSDWPDDPPKELNRIVDTRIGFFDDEAPAQIHRMPGRHGGPTFLRRGRLREVLDAPHADYDNPVHVFVVDQGMNENFVNEMGGAGTYDRLLWNTSGPQSEPAPGMLPTDHEGRYRSLPQWHAHMIVRNILAVAGGNVGVAADKRIHIYDIPVVPDRVTDVTNRMAPYGTAELIEFQYDAIKHFIDNCKPPNEGAVIVNAWGVQDRFRETPLGAFTEEERTTGSMTIHPLNQKIADLANMNRVDVVFAAGNNGLFTADPQAGALDRGPKRSIFLPAALENVWAAGASDANGTWIGLSSQGPAAKSGRAKPDFNIPSHFCEDMDAHVTNTGSSASCALMAGMLADQWRHSNGLGQRPDLPGAKGPGKARKRGHAKHSHRLGAGVPQHKKLR